MPNRRRVIVWTNGGLVYWHIYPFITLQGRITTDNVIGYKFLVRSQTGLMTFLTGCLGFNIIQKTFHKRYSSFSRNHSGIFDKNCSLKCGSVRPFRLWHRPFIMEYRCGVLRYGAILIDRVLYHICQIMLCTVSKIYRKISNVSRSKSQNVNVSCLVMQLSLRNLLKPCVKSRKKM